MTMAFFSQQFYLVVLISTSSLFLMMMINLLVYADAGGPTGLTLKLIHIDSPESPFYPGRNLTQLEIIHRDFQRSKARVKQLTASINSWQQVRRNNSNSKISYPDLASPPVYFDGVHYLVQIGIGTFPGRTFKSYLFMIDSGSDIFWLQCEGCRPCFPQVGGYYPFKDSYSYYRIPCNKDPWPLHPLCVPGFCIDDYCAYKITYADESFTQGVLATETLTLNSGMHGTEIIHNYVFGCGLEQRDFHTGHPPHTEVELAGILGLGGGDFSFLKQIGTLGQMRFAYCFQLWSDKWASKSNTYLRFGSDADHIGGVAVQMTRYYPMRGDTVYFVDLLDISVGEARVGYPPGSFDVSQMGVGGCVFDSGTPWTLIIPQLYVIFENHLIQYFAALDIHIADRHDEPEEYDTCFIKRDGFNNYPSITFHFKDADFEIEPEAAFFISDHIFCSAIARDDPVPPGAVPSVYGVLFGAIQQANHRVLYNLDTRRISWSREECVSPL